MLSIRTIMMPKKIGMKYTMEVELQEELVVEQWQVPAGIRVKTFQTENFGWIVLPPGTKDTRGFEIPRRFFKY